MLALPSIDFVALVSKRNRAEHQSQNLPNLVPHHFPLWLEDLACVGKWPMQTGGIQPSLPTLHPPCLRATVFPQEYNSHSLQDPLYPVISYEIPSLVWTHPLMTPNDFIHKVIDLALLPGWKKYRCSQLKIWLKTVKQNAELILSPHLYGVHCWNREWFAFITEAGLNSCVWSASVQNLVNLLERASPTDPG